MPLVDLPTLLGPIRTRFDARCSRETNHPDATAQCSPLIVMNCVPRIERMRSSGMDAFVGLVSKPSREVAQEGEDVGRKQHHGGVRTVRSDGSTLTASSEKHPRLGQGRKSRQLGRAVAPR